MKFGYARVSTKDQNMDRQIDSLTAQGCDRIFSEKTTGTKIDRPQLTHMLDMLRPGDTVVVDSLDRISRSSKDLINMVEDFKKNGVNLISIKENIDTSAPGSELMMTMFAMLSQFERDLIVERTRSGLEAARARGRVGGRPRVGTEKDRVRAFKMYDANILSNAEIAKSVGVSTATLSRWVAERKKEEKMGREEIKNNI